MNLAPTPKRGTIIYDTKLRRPACILIQAGMGTTISASELSRFPIDSWLVFPTDDMRAYEYDENILEKLIIITEKAWNSRPSTR